MRSPEVIASDEELWKAINRFADAKVGLEPPIGTHPTAQLHFELMRILDESKRAGTIEALEWAIKEINGRELIPHQYDRINWRALEGSKGVRQELVGALDKRLRELREQDK